MGMSEQTQTDLPYYGPSTPWCLPITPLKLQLIDTWLPHSNAPSQTGDEILPAKKFKAGVGSYKIGFRFGAYCELECGSELSSSKQCYIFIHSGREKRSKDSCIISGNHKGKGIYSSNFNTFIAVPRFSANSSFFVSTVPRPLTHCCPSLMRAKG